MAGKSGPGEFKQMLAAGGLPDLGPGPRAGILPHANLAETLDRLLTNTDLPSVTRDLIRGLILLWQIVWRLPMPLPRELTAPTAASCMAFSTAVNRIMGTRNIGSTGPAGMRLFPSWPEERRGCWNPRRKIFCCAISFQAGSGTRWCSSTCAKERRIDRLEMSVWSCCGRFKASNRRCFWNTCWVRETRSRK